MKPSSILKLVHRASVARSSRPHVSCRHNVRSTIGTISSPTTIDPSTVRDLSQSSSSCSTTVRTFSSPSMMGQLKDLRSLSGAPIVDCKKALGETNGDLDLALDWLRQHGAAKATKKLSGREAVEGLVACAVSDDGKSASIVKVSSETDFAGKSDAFVRLATHIAAATLNSNVEGILEPQSILSLEHESKSVQVAMDDAIVAIRENLGIASAVKVTTEDGLLISYVHGKADGKSNAGSAGAIVEIVGEGVKDIEMAGEVGKKLAMHIVAAKPAYLSPEVVPVDAVEKERAILESQISDSKKPPEVVEKIVTGKLRKFYSDVCLTEQEHMVEEGNPKVSKALKDKGLAVQSFELFSI